jgi:hypothetical protein
MFSLFLLSALHLLVQLYGSRFRFERRFAAAARFSPRLAHSRPVNIVPVRVAKIEFIQVA